MASRRKLAVAGVVFAVILAAAVVVLVSTPDTGAPLGTPERAIVRATPRAPPPRPVQTVRDAEPDEERRDVPPKPAFDIRDYDAEHGFTEAILTRADRLTVCWDEFVVRNGAPGEGRFTVELVVSGDGVRSTVGANVVNDDVDDELDRCVSAAMADAQFAPVEGVHRWIMPVPIR